MGCFVVVVVCMQFVKSRINFQHFFFWGVGGWGGGGGCGVQVWVNLDKFSLVKFVRIYTI